MHGTHDQPCGGLPPLLSVQILLYPIWNKVTDIPDIDRLHLVGFFLAKVWFFLSVSSLFFILILGYLYSYLKTCHGNSSKFQDLSNQYYKEILPTLWILIVYASEVYLHISVVFNLILTSQVFTKFL